MDSSKKILVTGGAGYIGSHTIVELVNAGFEPVIVDDFRNAQRNVMSGLKEILGFEPILEEVDICNRDLLEKVFENHKPKGVIHFAAYKAVGESVENPLMYYYNNLNGLVNCLELSEKYYVESFVFSSSCTVYGDPDGESAVVTEKSPVKTANSPYGATKQMGERILTDFAVANKKMKILILRYFNPVGAHISALIGEFPIGRPNNLLPVITQTGIGKLGTFNVNGNDYDTYDGTCIRDYIHVCDLAEAHVKGIEWLSFQIDGKIETLNIGTGKGTSVLEIINTFERVSGEKLDWSFGPRRAGDVVEIYADVSKAEKTLNWSTSRTVEDAVRDAWNWEKQLADA
jgi:UDP-glucose 4-epimerase